MSKLTPENEYFYILYNKAYSNVEKFQKKMDKAVPDSAAWQIAKTHRQYYAEMCVFLDSNSPSALGFCRYQKRP
jgi:hypothetical protein